MPQGNQKGKRHVYPNVHVYPELKGKRGPLSPQQIHQMIICVQSNSHRTTSECWWRTQMPRKANQSPQNKVWCVLVTQSCLTLCIPMDCSPLGSSVHGISQARILGGLPFPSPGNLPDPEIEPRSSALQADTSPSKLPGKLSDMMKKSDKQKLREFSITKPPLQQMLKDLLQTGNTREGKDLHSINPKQLRKW